MKRDVGDVSSLVKDVSVILLDIEGTTTSISFVKNELFPYVRREVGAYLQSTWDTEDTRRDVAALTKLVQEDLKAGSSSSSSSSGAKPIPSTGDRQEVIVALEACVGALMDADSKAAPLKTLQGRMWRRAYREGAVTGHVYEDVVPALEKWRALDKRLYIYSSGSVEAQKLLFAHSCHGDILHYFSGHFDTSVGVKVEAKSYNNILSQLGCRGEQVLFITDLEKEAIAAQEAGMRAVLSVRQGTAPLTQPCPFPTIASFCELTQGDSDAPSTPKRPRVEAEGKEVVKGDIQKDGNKNINTEEHKNIKKNERQKNEGEGKEIVKGDIEKDGKEKESLLGDI
ncbi:Enolase-phosphatase E1 [Chionoecetes opilio]|uniref:Enolase-phosphatase E1 n=1 Tax=Chionoecetes opilio TaxID=41210 RepID=A0A8J4XNU9_CHIOP|nr:Enolase-phosphatase E1 [Chionoecetes opilio]